MTNHETDALRRRLEGARKDDLLDAVILATGRIGGAGALLSALAEAQSARNRRTACRRHSAARYEARA